MKFAVTASFAALLAVAAAAPCDLAKMAPLAADADAVKCAADSKYNLVSMAAPSDNEVKQFCASSACQALLPKLTALEECDLPTGIKLKAGIVDKVSKCPKSTPAPASTTATPAASKSPAPAKSTTATPTPKPQTQSVTPQTQSATPQTQSATKQTPASTVTKKAC